MQLIPTGSTNKVQITIYSNGVEANADGAVTVTIYDADDATNALIATGAATNEQPLGIYSYVLDNTITNIVRILRVHWAYSVNGVATSQETFFEVQTPYTTVSDVIDFLQLGSKPSDPNYKDPSLIINMEKLARATIDAYTGQTFSKRYGYQELTADGSDALFTTERVLSIDQVYENGRLVIDNTASPIYNTFGFPLEISQTGKTVRIVNVDWDVRYDNQIDPTVLYYGRFRNNARYRIYGYIGWTYVPSDIKLCANILVGDYLANDAAWRNKYLAKIQMSEITLEMDNGAFTGTGNVQVDAILDQYRNVGIVVF